MRISDLNVNLRFSSYKAQGVVEDVTNRIVDHIRPGPYRLHWDSLMTTMDIMETFEEVKTCIQIFKGNVCRHVCESNITEKQ